MYLEKWRQRVIRRLSSQPGSTSAWSIQTARFEKIFNAPCLIESILAVQFFFLAVILFLFYFCFYVHEIVLVDLTCSACVTPVGSGNVTATGTRGLEPRGARDGLYIVAWGGSRKKPGVIAVVLWVSVWIERRDRTNAVTRLWHGSFGWGGYRILKALLKAIGRAERAMAPPDKLSSPRPGSGLSLSVLGEFQNRPWITSCTLVRHSNRWQ